MMMNAIIISCYLQNAYCISITLYTLGTQQRTKIPILALILSITLQGYCLPKYKIIHLFIHLLAQ